MNYQHDHFWQSRGFDARPDDYEERHTTRLVTMSHRDGDPDKTQEEYDRDNHADQENPNNDEYDK
jgi:hypothetical protein